MAYGEALALAADLHFQKMRIASDCFEVVNSLKDDYFGRFSSVINEIKIRS
jgi:hypothetical protein